MVSERWHQPPEDSPYRCNESYDLLLSIRFCSAASDGGIGSSSASESSIESGCLRPWPVRLQTTRSSERITPWSRNFLAAATDVAAAGSTKIPATVPISD